MGKELNLILVHQPHWQAYEDFERLGGMVENAAPEIEVFIPFNSIPSSSTRKRAASRPTLVVSPGELRAFKPLRGRIYAGRYIPKQEQCQLLEEAGLPVPRSKLLQPGFDPDGEEFGAFVVLKPTAPGLLSRGATRVMRTERVVYRSPEEYPLDHPGRDGPMMIQEFINTGAQPSHYRVLTLFGEPLYCQWRALKTPPVDLLADNETLNRTVIATNAPGAERKRKLVDDPDVLALARRVHSVAPDVPLKGVDIIREDRSGRLYVLEFNPGGHVWHISSRGGQGGSGLRDALAAEHGVNPAEAQAFGRRLMEQQFGFFEIATRVLVERTRADAI